MSQGSSLGDDGTVYLQAYLPQADRLWFSAFCPRCGRARAISVPAAIRMVGPGGTFGAVQRRLTCRDCGEPMGLTVSVDPRPREVLATQGPAPETQGR